MASRILGMGDVLSLIEKAEQAFDEKQAEELERKMRENRFDFNDYLASMDQIRNMGPLENLIAMIPGIDRKALQGVSIDEKQLDRVKAIILSMTPQERENPDIISPSRKRRIAAGSGRKVEEINRMLKSFDQMRDMMKKMNRPKPSLSKKKKHRK